MATVGVKELKDSFGNGKRNVQLYLEWLSSIDEILTHKARV